MQRFLLIPVLLLLLLASCTSDDKKKEEIAGLSDQTGLQNSPGAIDTIHCYFKSIKQNDSGYTVMYDPIIFVRGDQAVALINKEHPEVKSEEEIGMMMMNDYYISNKDTVPLSGHFLSDIPVKMQTFSQKEDGSLSVDQKISTAVFFKALTADQNWRMGVPYIIIRNNDEIISITEQYVP